MRPRRPLPCALLALLLATGCGTTLREQRVNVAVTTEPSDATVEVLQGGRQVAKGPAPLLYDQVREVRVSRRGLFVVMAVAGSVLTVGGLAMGADGLGNNDAGREPGPISTGAVLPLAMVVSGVVLAVVGTFAAVSEPAPPAPFSVTASRPGYWYPNQVFEPTDARLEVLLRGVPDEEPSTGD